MFNPYHAAAYNMPCRMQGYLNPVQVNRFAPGNGLQGNVGAKS